MKTKNRELQLALLLTEQIQFKDADSLWDLMEQSQQLQKLQSEVETLIYKPRIRAKRLRKEMKELIQQYK